MLNVHARQILGVCIALPALAILAVAGRVWAKKTVRNRLTADDWICIVDLVLILAMTCYACWIAVDGGYGVSLENTTTQQQIYNLQFVFVAELLATITVGTIKIAVLIFYKQVFVQKLFRLAADLYIIGSALWTIILFFLVFFQTDPVQGAWSLVPQKPAYPQKYFFAIYGATDIFLDLSIIIMPLPVIGSLKMGRRRKILVAGIFLLGAFCAVSSGIRLYYFVKVADIPQVVNNDLTTYVDNTTLWSLIEPCVSLIAACLPVMSPLFRKGHALHNLADYLNSYAVSLKSLVGARRQSVPSSEASVGDVKDSEVWAGNASSEANVESKDIRSGTVSSGRGDVSSVIKVEQTFSCDYTSFS